MANKTTWAVFIKEDGSFVPISFGDSEIECVMWLNEHKGHSSIFEDAYVGLIFDNVVIQE